MKRIFASFIVFLILFVPAYAQTPEKGESKLPTPATESLASGNKVEGLELPPDQTVPNDEGFVTLKAATKGSVKWLVVSGVKVKYFTVPDNSIVVSVPPQGGLITIFAVAVVDGKLTEFARTNININIGTTAPSSGTPLPVNTSVNTLHVTFLIDTNSVTADVAGILNSKSLQTAIASKGNFFRYYDIKSPVVAQKKLDIAAQKAGGSFVVIVQRNDGVIVLSQAMPRTEEQVAALLKSVGAL